MKLYKSLRVCLIVLRRESSHAYTTFAGNKDVTIITFEYVCKNWVLAPIEYDVILHCSVNKSLKLVKQKVVIH